MVIYRRIGCARLAQCSAKFGLFSATNSRDRAPPPDPMAPGPHPTRQLVRRNSSPATPFERRFTASVEASRQEIVVAGAAGTPAPPTDFPVDAFPASAGRTGLVNSEDNHGGQTHGRGGSSSLPRAAGRSHRAIALCSTRPAHWRQSRRRVARPPSTRASVKAEGGAAAQAKTRPWPVVLGVRAGCLFFYRWLWCIQIIVIARCAKRNGAIQPDGFVASLLGLTRQRLTERGLPQHPRLTPRRNQAGRIFPEKPNDKLPPTSRRRLRSANPPEVGGEGRPEAGGVLPDRVRTRCRRAGRGRSCDRRSGRFCSRSSRAWRGRSTNRRTRASRPPRSRSPPPRRGRPSSAAPGGPGRLGGGKNSPAFAGRSAGRLPRRSTPRTGRSGYRPLAGRGGCRPRWWPPGRVAGDSADQARAPDGGAGEVKRGRDPAWSGDRGRILLDDRAVGRREPPPVNRPKKPPVRPTSYADLAGSCARFGLSAFVSRKLPAPPRSRNFRTSAGFEQKMRQARQNAPSGKSPPGR